MDLGPLIKGIMAVIGIALVSGYYGAWCEGAHRRCRVPRHTLNPCAQAGSGIGENLRELQPRLQADGVKHPDHPIGPIACIDA